MKYLILKLLIDKNTIQVRYDVEEMLKGIYFLLACVLISEYHISNWWFRYIIYLIFVTLR